MRARSRLAFAVGFLAALAGCGTDDSIRTYELTRPTAYKAEKTPPGEYRLLGAMFPADEPTWFFKFSGRAEQIQKYEAEFDKMLHSVRMAEEKKAGAEPEVPKFVAPAGWIRTGPRLVRRENMPIRIQETLRFGSMDDSQEVTITQSGGSVLDNIGRWAAQVGRPYPRTEDLPRVSREFQADGVRGLRIDLDGPKNPSGGMRPKQGR